MVLLHWLRTGGLLSMKWTDGKNETQEKDRQHRVVRVWVSSVKIIHIEKNINMTTMIHQVLKWVEPNITPQGKSLPGWPSDGEDDEPIQRGYEPYVIAHSLQMKEEVLESIPTGRDPLDARKAKNYDRHV